MGTAECLLLVCRLCNLCSRDIKYNDGAYFLLYTYVAQLPYGALRLGPDTLTFTTDAGFRHNSGYNYVDSTIRAFSHTVISLCGVVIVCNNIFV